MPRRRDSPRGEVGRLYDEYGATLYRYALMILADGPGAEDALHEVFTTLLTRQVTIADEPRYLRRAIRNTCYSALRRADALDGRRIGAAGVGARGRLS